MVPLFSLLASKAKALGESPQRVRRVFRLESVRNKITVGSTFDRQFPIQTLSYDNFLFKHFPIQTLLDSDAFKYQHFLFRHFLILTISYSDTFLFRHFPILTPHSYSDTLQF